MWLLRLSNGLELTEDELLYWDNVPKEVEIKAVAFTIPRKESKPFVMEYSGFEEYCCAKIAGSPQGMAGRELGREVLAVKNGMVFQHDIFPDGMIFKMYPRDKCEVPERCFRRGRGS